MKSGLKIALVHDQLNQAGGAERVLFALTKLFPKAPIYTLLYDKKRLKGFENSKIKTSFIQSLPFSTTLFKWYLPFMPAAVENLNLKGFDIVISSSSALIKGIITDPQTLHICYCHTPTRYLWSDTNDYTEKLNQPGLIKKILPLYLSKLRTWDQLAAQRVDAYIANSNFVKDRIRNYYRRESLVVNPPVDTSEYKTSSEVGDYFVMVGRLRPYKKFDLAIKAFNKLKIPLKIIGIGEQEEELRKMSRSNIEFLGHLSEEEKRTILSKAKALISPQIEDFGINMIESMAAGRPVISYADGGALEIIKPGITGEFMENQTWESLVNVVLNFDANKYDSKVISEEALKYSTENFLNNFENSIEEILKSQAPHLL